MPARGSEGEPVRIPRVVWVELLLLAMLGCASGHASHGSSPHAARPISHHAAPSAAHSSSSHGHGGSHGGDALAGACIEILCGASACLADAAVADAEYPRDAEGNTVLSSVDDDGEAVPPAPLEVAPASAAPLAAVPALPDDLRDAVEVAELWLQRGERASFVARFVSAAEREAIASTPGRDAVAELAGRTDALLHALAACRSRGAEVQGDRATCNGDEPRLRWHLETYGWVIEDVFGPPPASAPIAAPIELDGPDAGAPTPVP